MRRSGATRRKSLVFGRGAIVSKRPELGELSALTYPRGAMCFICGVPVRVGEPVLSRAYDLRVSCPSCPWPADAIAERTI